MGFEHCSNEISQQCLFKTTYLLFLCFSEFLTLDSFAKKRRATHTSLKQSRFLLAKSARVLSSQSPRPFVAPASGFFMIYPAVADSDGFPAAIPWYPPNLKCTAAWWFQPLWNIRNMFQKCSNPPDEWSKYVWICLNVCVCLGMFSYFNGMRSPKPHLQMWCSAEHCHPASWVARRSRLGWS